MKCVYLISSISYFLTYLEMWHMKYTTCFKIKSHDKTFNVCLGNATLASNPLCLRLSNALTFVIDICFHIFKL